MTARGDERIITKPEAGMRGEKVMRFSSSVEINAPVEKVWSLIDKLEEWPQWMQSIKKIERVSEGPLAIGSQLSVTARVSRLTVNLLMTISEFVPERSVVMQGKALGTNLTRFYFLEPVNGKTKVTIGGEVSGLLAWMARRGGKAVSYEIAQAAKKRFESPG
ncbi:MAG TPA: SRPBCC family protein [Dehalococcoidia bacterium]|nr:SRPBCC family protein [Dehalococcoidia bacterium]